MPMRQKVKGQKSIKEIEQNDSVVITVRMTTVSVAFQIFLTLLDGLIPDS